jgi:hypothetical protein
VAETFNRGQWGRLFFDRDEESLNIGGGAFDFNQYAERVVADVSDQTELCGECVDEGPKAHSLNHTLYPDP